MGGNRHSVPIQAGNGRYGSGWENGLSNQQIWRIHIFSQIPSYHRARMRRAVWEPKRGEWLKQWKCYILTNLWNSAKSEFFCVFLLHNIFITVSGLLRCMKLACQGGRREGRAGGGRPDPCRADPPAGRRGPSPEARRPGWGICMHDRSWNYANVILK